MEEKATAFHSELQPTVFSNDPIAKGNNALAQIAAQDEHELTVWQAFRTHKKAIIWSLLVSTAIIMEGYDIVLINSFFAQTAFARKYGDYIPSTNSYQISASWQAGLGNAVGIGTIIGAFANGVQQGFSNNNTQWAYRLPFAFQWIWPVPLFAVLFFAPESPWHLVRVGNLEGAEKSVRRLGTAPEKAKQTVAMMVHTNELEKNIDAGTSYWDCFKGIDRRRTEIVCMTFAAQPFCGSAMGGTPTYFFVQAGLPNSISFKMTVGGLGLASVGTIVSWFLLGSFGRRTVYLWGLGGLTFVLWTVGIISLAAKDSVGGNYAQASMMLIWLLVYYLTVGPICYAIISETSSTRLRNKSVCLSRIAYYIAQIITNVVNPYMLNPTAGNWKGKTAFFWGGWAFTFFVWTFFRLPEMKGRTFEELDILFAKKVKARDFKKTDVDAYIEDLDL
ncbi:hypothetical protein ACMFMG_007960 [Clarireedia jacksonii]